MDATTSTAMLVARKRTIRIMVVLLVDRVVRHRRRRRMDTCTMSGKIGRFQPHGAVCARAAS
jgi:hypothetical protein